MTGTYPHTHGVARNSFVVPDQVVTLAELLSEKDFATAAFLGAAVLQSSVNFTQGFDTVDEDFSPVGGGGRRADGVHSQRRAEQVTDSVLRWLDDRPPGRLFLFVHYFDVHVGYKPPPPYDRMYRDDELPITGSLAEVKRVRRQLEEGVPGAEANAKVLNQLYAGEISYTDHHIGRLIDALREQELLESSLIVLTADHGETMWEHDDLFNHGLGVYDTTVLTPLIMRFPGRAHAGRVLPSVVSNIDVAPSLLDLLGISSIPGMEGVISGMEGVSFAPFLRQQKVPARPPVFSEATHPFRAPFEADPVWLNQNKRQSARSDQFKLIYEPTEEHFELYDLAADPGEKHPLGDEHPEGEALKSQLLEWRGRAAPLLSCTQESSEVQQQLEALGYVAASGPRKCNQVRE